MNHKIHIQLKKVLSVRYLLLVFALTIVFDLLGQGYYEIYGGPNTCNIIRTRQGQQLIFNHVLNAPLWNVGFQIGIRRRSNLESKLGFDYGLQVKLNGDRKSINVLAPVHDTLSVRTIYLEFPVCGYYKLLESRRYYFKAGLVPEFLIYQNSAREHLPIFVNETDFIDKLGLSGLIGFQFRLSEKISFDITYSQSLIYFYKLNLDNGAAGPNIKYYNQSFDLSIAYRL